jgi:UDP-N-acetylmuramoylalanine--D-glutamate ligase
MGVTGMSVACFLGGVGVDVLASDSRDALDPGSEARLRDAGVTVTLGANHVRPGDTVVISPGIPPGATLFREAHALGSEVISEPELFARCFGGPIVAITGTDGKSTVTTWIAHLLAVSGIGAVAGGNLGNPLIEEIGRAEMEIGVLEISAFQLITTPALAPAVALVTNLADDHLDHFGGDRVAYAAAKRRLVELCRPGATLIRADNDAAIGGWSAADGVHTHRYGSAATSAAWMEADALWLSTEEHGFVRLGDRGGLQLVGLHNAWNALGASIAAYAAGADLDAIREGLQSYTALPHRCAVIRTLRGVRWVNDSKGTTPHATSAALSGMSDPVVLIAGGSDKGADFDSLGALVRQHTRHVLLIGETAEAIATAIGPGHPVENSSTLEAAVERAAAIARPGDTVLLSPACASFDMFESYARRGECFEALVLRLSE